MTGDVITLDVTWEDILWQMLSCCGLICQSSTYKIVKVIKLFKKYKGLWEIFYDNYNLLL